MQIGVGLSIGAGREMGIISPLSLPGLALWLDATDAASITKDGSNKLSQWSDKSGNGRNFVQATGALQPTYNATGLNSLPAMVFSSSVIAPASAMSVTLGSTYWVLSPNSSISAATSPAQIILRANGTSFISLGVTSGSLTNEILTYNTQASGHFSSYTSGAASISNTGHVLTLTPNATSGATAAAIYLDGGSNLTSQVVNSYSQQTAVQFIGANNATPDNPFTGAISEILMFTTIHTAGDRVQVERYLGSKYGITIT